MEYEPVTHTTTDRRLSRHPSGATVDATVHRYAGGSGPTVYLQAAQHGIELNGPVTLRHLHERLIEADLAGTVVAVPVANPLAFDHRSYVTPTAYDARNANLNRVWPGDETGSFQERVAARLWELVTDADAVVDLHTGTPDMLAHVRFGEGSDARGLARAFGTEYLLADPDEGPTGMLRDAAERVGIPAITAELSNSRTVDRSAVETGVSGVMNVLREMRVLEGEPSAPAVQTVLRNSLEHTIAEESGLFEPRRSVAVGDRLETGDTLGAVYRPTSFERLGTVTVSEAGVVYSLARGVVVEGERLAAVATRG
ncbi:serine protease [Halorubrum sp. Ib24]|uniref:succinylglutamate desuccinylase/aspartoacylase family protein n=1 Tax=Halorubrum sp. Ib24 TaxID=1383850 RepID=UPI000B97F179|nr:succinylglutamate desuccinylase/aspartoacylase family protein [Halorubrum sp. Ib24]OYR42964.1 serine protease [Halorubrum sp. Ib24]